MRNGPASLIIGSPHNLYVWPFVSISMLWTCHEHSAYDVRLVSIVSYPKDTRDDTEEYQTKNYPRSCERNLCNCVKRKKGLQRETWVVMMAPIGSNQSERSKFCLDQSESSISPMWLIDVTFAHIWAWFYTWPHGIKNTRTQELNLHSWHSFNDRVKPGDKRDVCDALMTSRPFSH